MLPPYPICWLFRSVDGGAGKLGDQALVKKRDRPRRSNYWRLDPTYGADPAQLLDCCCSGITERPRAPTGGLLGLRRRRRR